MADNDNERQRVRRITATRAEDVVSVLRYFEGEKVSNQRKNLQNPYKRTSEALGISERSVYKILKKNKDGENFPADDEPEVRERDMEPSHHFKDIIREFIWEQRKNNKKVRSRQILAYLKSLPSTRNGGWKWGLNTVCSFLKRMGYTHKKRKGYYEIVQERPSIRRQVIKFILKIRELRALNKTIYYQDETWVYTNEVGQFDWINDEDDFDLQPGAGKVTNGPGQRAIVTAVVGPQGVLHESILIYRGAQEKRKDADYHSDMNSAVFLNWLETKVFPRIAGGVICVDHATYHTTLTDESKPPRSNMAKAEIIEYILKFAPTRYTMQNLQSRHVVELKLIAREVAPVRVMKLTELAERFNIEVVMLPVAHPNLNVIEFVWARVKQYVCIENQVQTLVTAQDKAREDLERVNGAVYNAILRDKVIPYENKILEIYENDMEEEDDDSSDSDADSSVE